MEKRNSKNLSDPALTFTTEILVIVIIDITKKNINIGMLIILKITRELL